MSISTRYVIAGLVMMALAFRFALCGQAFVVADRVSAFPVVLRSEDGASARFAADELSSYIERMVGVKPQVIVDADVIPERAIILTRIPSGRDLDIGDEGFRLRVDGGRLHVMSNGGRGLIYGVYELLETYGGIGWFSSDCTQVPERESFEVPRDLDVVQRPAFDLRWLWWKDIEDHPEFAVRCRLNGGRIPDRLGGCGVRFGGGLGICHTFASLLPVETHGKAHPEYYALRDGKRHVPENGGFTQPCLSNPDVVRIMTSNVLERIRADPSAGFYGVSQNDNSNYCECPACAAVDAEEGTHAGTIVRFVNHVADAVAAEFPEAKLQTLAYVYSRKPPRKTRLRPNVIPCLCLAECEFSHPIPGSAFAENRAFAADFEGWRNCAGNVFIWDYTTDFRNFFVPYPNVMSFQGNLRYFRDNNVKFLFENADGCGDHGEFAELKVYLRSKLLWDPDQDVPTLLDKFFRGYYGAAAPFVKEYFTRLHAQADDPAAKPLRMYDWYTGIVTDEFLKDGDGLWRKAEEAVRGDPDALYHVRMGRLCVVTTRFMRMAQPRTVYLSSKPGKRRVEIMNRAADYIEARIADAKARGRSIRFGETPDEHQRVLDAIKRVRSLPADTAEKPCSQAVIPATDLHFSPGPKTGEYVRDPELGHAVIHLFNTHHDWSVILPFSRLVCDPETDYRFRVRVKATAKEGEKRSVMLTGVWDPVRHRNPLGREMHLLPSQADGSWRWFDLAELKPDSSAYLWISPGLFDDAAGEASPVDTLFIDAVEITRLNNKQTEDSK